MNFHWNERRTFHHRHRRSLNSPQIHLSISLIHLMTIWASGQPLIHLFLLLLTFVERIYPGQLTCSFFWSIYSLRCNLGSLYLSKVVWARHLDLRLLNLAMVYTSLHLGYRIWLSQEFKSPPWASASQLMDQTTVMTQCISSLDIIHSHLIQDQLILEP